MSASTALHVFSLLLLVELSLSATDLYVTLGSSLFLRCVPPNYLDVAEPRYLWTRVPQQDTLAAPRDDSSLSVDEIGPKDAGLYECVTEGWVNRWGDERKIRLKVAFFVHITDSTDFQQEELLDAEDGDSVTLPCSSGPRSPSSLVTWHREVRGGKEELDLGLNGEGGGNGSRRIHWAPPSSGPWSIKVNDVTVEDSGVYCCSWLEDGVLKNHTVELMVKAPPTLPPPRCHGHTTPWETCEVEKSRSGKAILAESLTEFSMHLYSLLSKSNPSSNLLFSPLSIAGALSNILLGARGQTRTSLERSLHLPVSFFCLHSEMKNLRQELKESMEIASQIFYHADLKLEETFANQSEVLYGARPQQLSESAERNVDTINAWVADKTHQRIKELVKSLPSSAQLVVLNAVYFIGKWQVKFQKGKELAKFLTSSGGLVPVPVLYSSKYKMALSYSKELEAQVAAVALSGQVRLFMLLPNSLSSGNLEALESKMSVSNVRELVKDMETVQPEMVEVTLPILKLDISTDLMGLLEEMGLSDLFGSPNLCGLSAEDTYPPLALSDAQHRSFLSLTESGVEAGAATVLSFSRSFRSFSALRPFLFMLWSDRADCPLFLGRVTKP